MKMPRRENPIKRPLNSFMIYRKSRYHDVAAQSGDCNNISVSRIIARLWAAEPENVKQHYQELAAEEKRRHQAMYPWYKYRPRKKNHLKDKQNVNNNHLFERQQQHQLQKQCLQMQMHVPGANDGGGIEISVNPQNVFPQWQDPFVATNGFPMHSGNIIDYNGALNFSTRYNNDNWLQVPQNENLVQQTGAQVNFRDVVVGNSSVVAPADLTENNIKEETETENNTDDMMFLEHSNGSDESSEGAKDQNSGANNSSCDPRTIRLSASGTQRKLQYSDTDEKIPLMSKSLSQSSANPTMLLQSVEQLQSMPHQNVAASAFGMYDCNGHAVVVGDSSGAYGSVGMSRKLSMREDQYGRKTVLSMSSNGLPAWTSSPSPPASPTSRNHCPKQEKREQGNSGVATVVSSEMKSALSSAVKSNDVPRNANFSADIELRQRHLPSAPIMLHSFTESQAILPMRTASEDDFRSSRSQMRRSSGLGDVYGVRHRMISSESAYNQAFGFADRTQNFSDPSCYFHLESGNTGFLSPTSSRHEDLDLVQTAFRHESDPVGVQRHQSSDDESINDASVTAAVSTPSQVHDLQTSCWLESAQFGSKMNLSSDLPFNDSVPDLAFSSDPVPPGSEFDSFFPPPLGNCNSSAATATVGNCCGPDSAGLPAVPEIPIAPTDRDLSTPTMDMYDISSFLSTPQSATHFKA